MEVASQVKPKIMEDKTNKATADPAATSIIPDVIEEHTRDSEGKIVTIKYLRGKLLGKVIDIMFMYVVWYLNVVCFC